MDIKRLLTRGGQVFAAEIKDGSEQYKVLIEALGNTVILPALVADGWKLSSLPLSLQKNGIPLEDFPKMEYSPTPQEELDMYDLMGTAMSMEERRTYLSVEDVKTIETAKGSYTINTREELLNFLTSISSVKLPTDFLPLNYFVHPSARFSLEEYNSVENREYVRIIEKRRRLSLQQFNNLRAWALANGLKKDYSALDLMSFYFQWGICGLSLNVLSKKREERFSMQDMGYNGMPTDMTYNGATTRATYVYDFGLVDRFQNEYRKPGTERYQLLDSKTAVQVSQALSDDETAVVRVRMPQGEWVEEWSAIEANVAFNERFLSIGETVYTSLSPTGNYGIIHPRFWNMSTADEMNDDMYLHAIAEEFIERRRIKVSVSSFQALCESGCSPLAALLYMRDKMGLLTKGPLDTDEESLVLATDEIIDYLRGEDVDPERAAIIEDMMNGVVNIDKVANGIESDANQTTDKLYSQLYCIHHILGIPIRTIYEKIRDFDYSSSTPVKFSDGTISVTLRSKPIDAAYRGFIADKQAYRLKQVETATNYLWVTSVARELGPEEATRHVAVCGYTATQSSRTEAIIAELEDIYREATLENVPDPAVREAYDVYSRCFAVDAWFSGAMRGFYVFPKEISKEVIRIDDATRKLWRSAIEGPKVETTTLLADNAVYYELGTWHWYCVNAIIQPYEVVPRKTYRIKETSLAAVWYDTSTLDFYPELLKRGLVEPGMQPWSMLTFSAPVFRSIPQLAVSLTEYYDKSQLFVDNFDRRFHLAAPPHPLELSYPKLAQDEDLITYVVVTPSDDYKYKVGTGKVLEHKETTVEGVVATKPPIQFFKRLTAEDFFFTGGKVAYPVNVGKEHITVGDGNTLFVDDHLLSAADVGSLDPSKYPVTHMYGRKYLVCDVLGALWTVEV